MSLGAYFLLRQVGTNTPISLPANITPSKPLCQVQLRGYGMTSRGLQSADNSQIKNQNEKCKIAIQNSKLPLQI
jgi:hypothetical protein